MNQMILHYEPWNLVDIEPILETKEFRYLRFVYIDNEKLRLTRPYPVSGPPYFYLQYGPSAPG